MGIEKLPNEVLYDVISNIVADYVDAAIASPPRPDWLRPFKNAIIDKALHEINEKRSKNGLDPTSASIKVGSDMTVWSEVSQEEFIRTLQELATRTGATRPLPSTGSSGQAVSVEGNGGNFVNDLFDDPEEESGSDGLADDEDSDWASDDGVQSDSAKYTDDSDYDSEGTQEEYEELVRNWEATEKHEPLPENAIIPLLGVNRDFRETTLDILSHALNIGYDPATDMNLRSEIEALLRNMRRRWRISHTRPLLFSIDENIREYEFNGREMSELIASYLDLCSATYSLRSMHRIAKLMASEEAAEITDEGLIAMMGAMKDTKYTHLHIAQSVLRPRVMQRAHIFNMRLKMFMSITKRYSEIRDALSKALTVVGLPARPRMKVTTKSNADALKEVMQSFVAFDDKHWGKEKFSTFPRPLIKSSQLRVTLRQIHELRLMPELKKQTEIMDAARLAGVLLSRWRRRCVDTKTMYVVLQA